MPTLPLRRPIDGPSSVVALADTVLDGEEAVEEEAEREKLRPQERDGNEPRHPAIGRNGLLGNWEDAANTNSPSLELIKCVTYGLKAVNVRL